MHGKPGFGLEQQSLTHFQGSQNSSYRPLPQTRQVLRVSQYHHALLALLFSASFCVLPELLTDSCAFPLFSGRVAQDYMVLVLGHPVFSILRLLLFTVMMVHLFACLFYRIKKDSAASEEDVNAFYKFFRVDPTVS